MFSTRCNSGRPLRILFSSLICAIGAMPLAANATPTLFLTTPGVIGSYTTSGTPINANLVTGLITGPGYADPFYISTDGTNLFTGNWASGLPGSGFVSEYTTSGVAVNTHLITGLDLPIAPASDGANLYVPSGSGIGVASNVGKYTASGATVDANFLHGFSPSGSLVGAIVSGSNLFVLSGSTLGEFTTSGATVNATLITGLTDAIGFSLVGSDFYIATNFNNNTGGSAVAKYNISGTVESASLISGLSFVQGISVFDTNIYLATESGNVAKYTTSGDLVNPTLISGLNNPSGILVMDVAPPAAIPEPTSLALLSAGLAPLVLCGKRGRGKRPLPSPG